MIILILYLEFNALNSCKLFSYDGDTLGDPASSTKMVVRFPGQAKSWFGAEVDEIRSLSWRRHIADDKMELWKINALVEFRLNV